MKTEGQQNNVKNSLGPENKPNGNTNYQKLFENVFEFSPISIWEEDLSGVYEGLEKIRAEGISNIKLFLNANHDIVENILLKIKILNVNKTTVELFEADSKEELIGAFGKFFDKSNIEIFIDELAAIWNRDKNFSSEYRAFSVKGKPIFIHVQFRVPQQLPESKNVLINISDLSKLKNVEEQLFAEHELYKTIFAFAPTGILIEDKHGNILDANEAQHFSLGFKNGELIGKNVCDIASSENKFLIEENISRILNGEILIHELESIRKDGTRCINSLNEIKIPLPNGENGILNISIDVTEKRKLQVALKKREKTFVSLFNLSSEILIVVEPNEGKVPIIALVNDTAVQKYGYTREEMIGKPITIFISEKEMIKKRISHLLEGQTITFGTMHHRKNGTLFPVEVTAKLVTLFGKQHVYSVARDISLKKEQEQKQKQRIKFLQAAKEISEIILFEDKVYNLLSRVIKILSETLKLDRAFIYEVDIKNAVGKMQTVWNNPELDNLISAENVYPVETFGDSVNYLLSREKTIVESYFDKIHPAFSGEPSKIIHEKLKIKTLLWLPFSFSANGFLLLSLNQTEYKRIFANAEKDFIQTVTQQINLAIMKIGFLNKQKEDEAELKKLSQAVEQSPAEVIITNTKGEIEYVNHRFFEATGYSLKEVKGKNPRFLKSGYTTDPEYKKLWDKITAGETWTGEFKNKKKNGELFWESAAISSIKNENGKIQYYLGIKEVITEKKEILGELKKAKIKAEKSSQLKSMFLSQMSHEIRTPVNTMISFSELLRDDLEGKVRQELAGTFDGLERAGTRIIRTTELLLNLSEIQTNAYEPNFKMIDLNIEILGPIVLEYKRQAAARNLKFDYRIKNEDAVVKADRYSVEKILRQLIENAIKFTETGFVKVVVSKSSKENVIVQVSDSGIGISEKFLPHLYDAFSQEDTGYSRRYDGNGIGLSLVNEYCKLNKINIEVKSKKGEGTVFTLIFEAAIWGRDFKMQIDHV